MNALHVITGLNVGGAEKMLLKVLANDQSGVKHAVVSLTGEGTLSTALSKYADVFHFNLRQPRSLLRFLRFSRRCRPDVVMGWMYHAALIAQVCFRRQPVVWNIRHSIHDIQAETLTLRLVIKVLAWLSPRADKIIYNSVVAKDQHARLGFHASRCQFVPNGFDTRRFSPSNDLRNEFRRQHAIAPDDTVIGTVGRFHPMKNHLGFVESAKVFMATSAQPGCSYCFVLAGRGLSEGNGELMAAIRAAGIAGQVRLIGEVDEVEKVLNGFDLFTLPSLWGEGFPNVLGEAMLCELLCTATDVGDARYLIDDPKWILPTFKPEALAALWSAQLALTHNEQEAIKRASRARIVERYSIGSISAQYASILTADERTC